MRFCGILLVLVMLSGCRHTVSRGLRFDFRGEQAQQATGADLTDALTQVIVQNQFGRVSVQPAEAGAARWEWELTTWANSQSEAEQWLEVISMDQRIQDGAASWQLAMPEHLSGLRGVRSHLTLWVPPEVDVQVTNRGDVHVQELVGNVRIGAEHGNIQLAHLPGRVEILQEHGQLEAAFLANSSIRGEHGSARLQGVDGDLLLAGGHYAFHVTDVSGAVRGKSEHGKFELENVLGDVVWRQQHEAVSVRNAQAKVEVRNEHGGIQVTGSSPRVTCDGQHANVTLHLTNPDLESVRVAVEHGDVDLTLPPSVETIDIREEFGDVQSELGRAEGSRVHVRIEHGRVRARRGT